MSPRALAGCVVLNTEGTHVLLVTSRRHKGVWILPKGGIEGDESALLAAIRETREEAGVVLDRASVVSLCISETPCESPSASASANNNRHQESTIVWFCANVQTVLAPVAWPEFRHRLRRWVLISDAYKSLLTQRPAMRSALASAVAPALLLPENQDGNTDSSTDTDTDRERENGILGKSLMVHCNDVEVKDGDIVLEKKKADKDAE